MSFKNINQLIEHIRKQIDAKDGRQPNAEWIVKELEKIRTFYCEKCGHSLMWKEGYVDLDCPVCELRSSRKRENYYKEENQAKGKHKCQLCLKTDDSVKHWIGGGVSHAHEECADILERGIKLRDRHIKFMARARRGERDGKL